MSNNSVSAVNNLPFNNMLGLYNPAMYYDDFDIDYGMGQSIFTPYAAMGSYSGVMPGLGFNNKDYFNYMKDYQKFITDYNINQQNMQRNADLRINASMEGIIGAATVLRDKITRNEQDQVPKAFEAYVKSVALAYGKASDKEILSRALTLYQQMTGKTLFNDLRENGHSSFMQGLLQSLSFSTTYRLSAEDNISAITNQPVALSDKCNQNTGRMVGAIGVGSIVGGLTSAFTKSASAAATASTAASNVSKFAKFRGKGLLAGFIAGTAALLLSFITGKVST